MVCARPFICGLTLLLCLPVSCDRTNGSTTGQALTRPATTMASRANEEEDVFSKLSKPGKDTLNTSLTREQIEQDLVLEVSGPKTIPSGGAFQAVVNLSNRSRIRTHRIVLPNDGYDVGWSWPAIFCTAEHLGSDGAWSPIPRRTMGRCGNIDGNWQDCAFEIKPGQSIPLHRWVYPSLWLYFWESGRTRLTVQYVYGGIWQNKKLVCGPGVADGPMGGVPGFELIASTEFDVRPAPLTLSLRIIGTTDTVKTMRQAEFLEAILTNCTTQPVQVLAPGRQGSQLVLEGVYREYYEGPSISPITLEAGQSLSLFKDPPFKDAFFNRNITIDHIERRTFAVLQNAYVDRGQHAAIRSNDIILYKR